MRLRRRAWGRGCSFLYKGGKRGRQEDALERPTCRARGGSGVSPLRGPRNRRLGPLAWAFAVSLQELRAHLQYADQDADGASAQEGPLARSRARDDRGQEPGETPRRSAESIRRSRRFVGVIGFCAPLQATSPGLKEKSSKRTKPSFSNPSRADGPTCRERREGAAERPGRPRPSTRTTFPSLSPATGTAPPSTRSWPRSTALR